MAEAILLSKSIIAIVAYDDLAVQQIIENDSNCSRILYVALQIMQATGPEINAHIASLGLGSWEETK